MKGNMKIHLKPVTVAETSGITLQHAAYFKDLDRNTSSDRADGCYLLRVLWVKGDETPGMCYSSHLLLVVHILSFLLMAIRFELYRVKPLFQCDLMSMGFDGEIKGLLHWFSFDLTGPDSLACDLVKHLKYEYCTVLGSALSWAGSGCATPPSLVCPRHPPTAFFSCSFFFFFKLILAFDTISELFRVSTTVDYSTLPSKPTHIHLNLVGHDASLLICRGLCPHSIPGIDCFVADAFVFLSCISARLNKYQLWNKVTCTVSLAGSGCLFGNTLCQPLVDDAARLFLQFMT